MTRADEEGHGVKFRLTFGLVATIPLTFVAGSERVFGLPNFIREEKI